ncbi:MAG: EamA family transporter [Rhodospirillales bacterium]|jgi:drug/metabolite transporter (DMT)-like permease
MAVLLGLACAVIWGTSALLTRDLSRAAGAARAFFWTQVFGLCGLVAMLAATGPGVDLAGVSAGAWAIAVLFSLLNATATLTLYSAFRTGAMSLVVPVSASYAAVTTLLAVAAGERLGVPEGAGVLLCLGGVALALVSRTPVAGGGRIPPGLGLAVLAAAQYGAAFWLLGLFVAPALGGVVPILLTRLVPVVAIGLAHLSGRLSVPPPAGATLGRAVAVGFMDAGAFVCLAVGYSLGTESVSVVTVLGSLYSAVGALLAVLVLRERLVAHQLAGVGLILAGVLVLNG